ncbi:hypothetical protein, partial [Sulfoacidibacillus ferrooxidans]|uniref:hypothetical protein n=1 Tax=Sulfoacidibacillus ferrooxidans TaxID=2005001 RepID=UPI001F508BC5
MQLRHLGNLYIPVLIKDGYLLIKDGYLLIKDGYLLIKDGHISPQQLMVLFFILIVGKLTNS